MINWKLLTAKMEKINRQTLKKRAIGGLEEPQGLCKNEKEEEIRMFN